MSIKPTLIGLLLALGGCAGNSLSVPVEIGVLRNSLRCGVDLVQAQLRWLDDQQSLAQRYALFHPTQPAPAIDFTRYRVLLVAMGQQPSTGYRLNYLQQKQANKYQDRLRIPVAWQRPGIADEELSEATSPCLLLVVPTDKYSQVQVTDQAEQLRLNWASEGS